ncbi:LysR substrate-binding domain-containing protein [Hyphomicrobium sp. MC1]|uniref:LysR substrate-binding domain-containing protein n=1 Tax=Hyphomicrobium sp. (strain MC1) TaxID=717785 RepID=UPI000213DD66|nr:LysR substrate-binding domain-containing protein [Hyphomicrobium sp. MC1]CCB66378.1 Transcriptional regulator, LysR family [Hyphomicrobium sp. MC1]
MTLEQLRIFVAVAEKQHVTQAAHEINITQSAASSAIAALEERYAVKLFDRIGRRIELTDAGRVFLVEARGVLARAATAEKALADLAGLKRGSLSIYASQTIVNYWLPPFLAIFNRRYPEIQLKLKAGNTQQVAIATHDGIADIGFIEGTIDDPHLSVRTVEGDRLVIVVAPNHPLAGKETLEVADIKAMTWVMREQGSGTRGEFETSLKDHGVETADLNVVLELPSNEAVCAAVEAGVGATAISNLVAEAGLLAGKLVALEFPLPQRSFYILHHKERYASQAELALLELMGATGRPPVRRREKAV